jgi:hypothetical protein
LSFGGRVARVALIAAVSAAVGAATLPVLLKQATPTEEAIARIAPLPPRPSEDARFVAVTPFPVPMEADATPASLSVNAEPAIVPPAAAVVASIPTPAEPPPAMTQVEPPSAAPPIALLAPPATAPAESASPEPFPPVQPPTIDTSANAQPPAEQAAPQAAAPTATASLPPPAAGKPAWRKRVAHNGMTRRKSVRPRPFSIRALLAALHLR